MNVQIVKTGFSTVPVTLADGATVQEALTSTNMGTNGCTVAVNGEPSDTNRVLFDGDIVQLIGKVKGGGPIEVSLVKFGEDTQKITVETGSTVNTVLVAAGYGEQGYTISVNGSPATLQTVINDSDIIQLVPKVKGGMVDRAMHAYRVFVARWF